MTGEVAAALRHSARVLFLADGYVATTTKQIAGQAGVSERTLFNLYSQKALLLRECVIEVVTQGGVGPDASARPDFQRAMRAADPTRQIALFVIAVSRIHRQVAPLAAVSRQAALADPAAAEFWEWGTAQGRRDCDTFIASLRDQHSVVQRGRYVVDATTTLTSHEVYWQLVETYGWTTPRYRDWLRPQLLTLLLRKSW